MLPFTIRTLDRGDINISENMVSQREDTPNERHKEYLRAVKETKLDHLFRKPFVSSLEGHKEGVVRIVTSSADDNLFASSDYNGQILLWDLSTRKMIHSVPENNSSVRALSFMSNSFLYSSGLSISLNSGPSFSSETVFTSTASVLDISTCNTIFAASNVDGIDIFDQERIKPVATYKTSRSPRRVMLASSDTIYAVEGNQITGYDTRTGNQEFSITAPVEVNAFAVDPTSPAHIAAALNSGDIRVYNIAYTKRSTAYQTPYARLIRGHTSPVLDIQYLPNGKKIVTASQDKTVRIFGNTLTHSQEHIYHNRRMLLVNAICCTNDSNYILSGSTDANIRIWRANPNKPCKLLSKQEENARTLGSALIKKYREVEEISSLKRHIILPRPIKGAAKNRYSYLQAQKKKDQNRKNNGKKDSEAEQ